MSIVHGNVPSDGVWGIWPWTMNFGLGSQLGQGWAERGRGMGREGQREAEGGREGSVLEGFEEFRVGLCDAGGVVDFDGGWM